MSIIASFQPYSNELFNVQKMGFCVKYAYQVNFAVEFYEKNNNTINK